MKKSILVFFISHCFFQSAAFATKLINSSDLHSYHVSQQVPIDFLLFDVNLANAYNDDSIHDNPMANVHVKTLSLINKKLGISNQLIQAPFLRVKRRLESSQPTCSPAKLKTSDREKSYLFSAPTGLTLSYRLFSKTDIAHSHPQLFNRDGHLIHLNKLTDVNPNFRILQFSKQSYGDVLDTQLNSIHPINKVSISSTETFEKTSDLFLKNRADFLLTAPVIFIRSYPQQIKSLHSYIVEGQQPYFVGYLMCNDFPETRQYLSDFNRQLFKFYQRGEFKALLMKSHTQTFSHQVGNFVDDCLEVGECSHMHNAKSRK